jgi:hypothetical protein
MPKLVKNFTPQLDLSNELLCAPNGNHMQKLLPQEVDISTSHLGGNPFGATSPRVRILVLYGFLLLGFSTYVKISFQPLVMPT